MENINFESIKDKRKREVYVNMWGNNPMVSEFISKGYIAKTPVKAGKSYSDNSYCFNIDGKNEEDTLIEIFGIPKENQQLFRNKFAMACSGSGKERIRITRLHSSSLCALLFFYNVTKDNPLKIENVGTFTNSAFEFMSKVINPERPSCMDVVLTGKADNGEDAVLFLESKFSEYYLYASKKSSEISKEYAENEYSKTLYEKFKLSDGLKIEYVDKKFKMVNSAPNYLNGIKQMISHYVGVKNNLNNNFYYVEKNYEIICDEYEDIIKNIQGCAKVYLGEILFDNVIEKLKLRDGTNCKAAYSDLYNKLALEMNKEINKSKDKGEFKVLERELTYSIFKDKDFVDERVRKFYFG